MKIRARYRRNKMPRFYDEAGQRCHGTEHRAAEKIKARKVKP